MGTELSYLVPVEELTLTDMANFRRAAVAEGLNRAVAKKVSPSQDELIVRHAQCVADFGCATDQWITTPLAILNTAYSVFPAAAGTPLLANTRVAVFYKVQVDEAPIPVSILSFRQGAAAGTTKANFDLEQFATTLIPAGFFTQPVAYDPQEVLNIVVTCRIATTLFTRVILSCFIIEPKGATLS